MANAILEVSILFTSGSERTIFCTEEEYNHLLTCGRLTSSVIEAEGYFDCLINWDDVSFMAITDVVEGDEYGETDESTTTA